MKCICYHKKSGHKLEPDPWPYIKADQPVQWPYILRDSESDLWSYTRECEPDCWPYIKADMWLKSEDMFYYYKIVDNYYYQLVDLPSVSNIYQFATLSSVNISWNVGYIVPLLNHI